MAKRTGSQLCAVVVMASLLIAGAQGDSRFTEGQSVVALVNLNVRNGPGGNNSSLGVQPAGSRAAVVSSGPAEVDGMYWWQLRWENGIVGWSAQGDSNEAFLGTAASPESRVGPVSDVFAERWLRVFSGLAPTDTPRFNGPVATVTRTSRRSNGQVSERNTWHFDERGWPTTIEWTLNMGETTYLYSITWNYGGEGLPTSIDWRSRSDSETLAITWYPSTVEVSSANFSARYYDHDRDTLTVEHSVPIEMKQVYVFQADGSHAATNSAPFDGTWEDLVRSTSDVQNIVTESQSEIVTNTTSVLTRDAYDNPTSASTRTRGLLTYSGTVTWDIEYR